MENWISNNKVLASIIAIIFIGIIVVAAKSGGSGSLAKCLKASGAKFYGSKSCPHCNSQKKMFGDDASNLPYVECLGANGTQNEVCNANDITAYPTWVFADGSRQQGELSMEVLAQKAKCKAK